MISNKLIEYGLSIVNNDEIAEMIEEEAVKTLMNLGSHIIMEEHLKQNIVVFTPDNDEEE